MTLSDLSKGHAAVVTEVTGAEPLRGRLLDLGVLPGTELACEGSAPLGDPLVFRLGTWLLALRKEEAELVRVSQAAEPFRRPASERTRSSGPRNVSEPTVPPFSEPDAPLTLALAGNPNCGKTTLFNRLTGKALRTGNFPGVTVERAEGRCLGHPQITVSDLPGLYSLTPRSLEERAARDALLAGTASCVVNVVDAGNMTRSLALTLELMELPTPLVLCLNMMDLLRAGGGAVDCERLAELLGVPVVPVSAAAGEGLDALLAHAVREAQKPSRPKPVLPRGSGAEERFRAAAKLVRETVTEPPESRRLTRTRRLDRLLTGRWTALPLLLLAALLVFGLAFGMAGPMLQAPLERGLDRLCEAVSALLRRIETPELLRGLAAEGILRGVGSVIAFLPVVAALFFCLALLEDTGYMARVALLLDRPLGKLGLSGRSAASLCLGFGCTVPAVMALRTLPSERDRRRTAEFLPFVSCPAKLPVYALLSEAVWPGKLWLTIPALYLTGLLTGAATAAVRRRALREERTPFLMELPLYRLPTARNVARYTLRRSWEYLERALTVVMLASAAVWLLRSVDGRFRFTGNGEESVLKTLCGALTPVFAPLGLGDWRLVAALAAGLTAKESAASTLAVLYGGAVALDAPSAAAMLVFCLLYPPCAAALGAVKRELGTKTAVSLAARQTALAWAAAFCARAVCILTARF